MAWINLFCELFSQRIKQLTLRIYKLPNMKIFPSCFIMLRRKSIVEITRKRFTLEMSPWELPFHVTSSLVLRLKTFSLWQKFEAVQKLEIQKFAECVSASKVGEGCSKILVLLVTLFNWHSNKVMSDKALRNFLKIFHTLPSMYPRMKQLKSYNTRLFTCVLQNLHLCSHSLILKVAKKNTFWALKLQLNQTWFLVCENSIPGSLKAVLHDVH